MPPFSRCPTPWPLALALTACAWISVFGQAQTQGPARPASQAPPATTQAQSYPAEQVRAGQARFASECGFCHGRDAGGGESGPDLTRSQLVADDVRGDKIGPVIRNGRIDKGMPAIALSNADLAAVVAFIHDAKTKAESSIGGRRTVDVDDLTTGNADAGQRYFNEAGGCIKCHAIAGDFAKIGARYQGLALLQRMLYPGSGRDAGPAPTPPAVTVKTKTGETVTGTLAYRDEFTISLKEAAGWTRSWPIAQVTATVDAPLRAHIDQLGKYTDEDMHNVLAYLHRLR
jgi:cytochrome c oxidase cbb3-type subunit 3